MDLNKLKIDKDKCIGCGTCTVFAGKTFIIDEGGKAKILPKPTDSKEQIIQAIENCPMQAISFDRPDD